MKFLYPVPSTSTVTQTFAEHVARAQANHWTNYNGGIDWAVPTGTPVKAAQEGKVLDTRRDATGYGIHVRIQHAENYLTIYGHLMDFSVNVGQTVKAGEVIGRSDNTGNSTGPHLHFELRHNNVAIDPAPLLVTSLDGGEPQPTTCGGTLIPEPQVIATLPKVCIITSLGVNIRQGPGFTNPVVGFLPTQTKVEVLRIVTVGPDKWLQIGYNQYIAQLFNSNTLAMWIQD